MNLDMIWQQIDERIRNRIIKDPSGCWIWQGQTNGKDIPFIVTGGTRWSLRHEMFMLYCDPQAKASVQVHTKCGNSKCLNPEHLYAPSIKKRELDKLRQENARLDRLEWERRLQLQAEANARANRA